MADNDTDKQTAPNGQETKNDKFQLIMILAFLVVAIIWGIHHPSTALRIVAVLLGFGGIVMIHEFGHFIVAKLGGIKVEAFSIGMPPVALGIRKLKKGWRLRVFPNMNEPEHLQEGDHETEYQIGLLPIGGFVKMLGQSDTGAAEALEDPRSYANRPIWIRICVVSAGVIFNAISAAIIFMALYMNGIDLPAGVVGQVVKNSPAYDAGIKPGDEIVEVNGEYFEFDGRKCVDFETVFQAPVLSASGQPIEFTIRRDGVDKEVSLVAEKQNGDPSSLRFSGLLPATQLVVSRYVRDPNSADALYRNYDLCRRDKIKSVNGKAVLTPWDYEAVLSKTFQPTVELGVSRLQSEAQAAETRTWPLEVDEDGPRVMSKVEFPMAVGPTVENFRDQYDLAHFGALVPRLTVQDVVPQPKAMSLSKKVVDWFKATILRRPVDATQTDLQSALRPGDVLVKMADCDYPNYKQLRELTIEYKDKELPVTVLRKNKHNRAEPVELSLYPKAHPGSKRVTVGFVPVLDMASPVVAQVLPVEGLLGDVHEIPAGAVITAVNGQPVQTFFEIATQLQASAGKEITLDYQIDQDKAHATLTVPEYEPVHAEAYIQYGLPLDELTENYKASNPLEAMGLGFKKVGQFVKRNYKTIGRLFQRDVPTSALSGPVGIISMTYTVTGASIDRYLYFLGLISSCLAVMNLLPLPVLDGGHIVLLIIEKMTGKPVHEKILAPIMYVGLALLLGLILWISYKDVVRLLFGS